MTVKIQTVLDQLTKSVGNIENTVDTLKFGSSDTVVTKIAVSFMPTYEVIKEAKEIGANLLITHEGVFFSHWDKSDTEYGHTYDAKLQLINESGLAIYRLHDYIHRYKPDGITKGLVHELNWGNYIEENSPVATVLKVPTMTLKEVVEHVKRKLAIDYVRAVGNASMPVSRIGLFVGFRGGGASVIPFFEKENLDLVIYGEGHEWETPEYVRDSVSVGNNKSLIILGHAESEEPGMKYFAKELKQLFPDIPVHFIPGKPNFQIL